MADKVEQEGPEDVSEETFVEPVPGYVTTLALSRVEKDEQDEDARALLREQTRVLHLQAEHLHEQREVQLSHLRARRISEWIKVGLQVITAGAALAALLLVIGLVLEAARSRSVVVDAFDAPPALAARGVSGKVVASAVLDGLIRLQAATRATAAKRKLANAWGSDIKVEVPETGVSIGELKRLLHEMLGRDVHVEGDLVQKSDGRVRLTVRGDEVAPASFDGDADDLEGVANRAAEYVYGQADPYLLAAYLSTAGRTAEALAFLAQAYPHARPGDRPDLLNQWGNALFALDRPADAMEKYREAVEIAPDFWKGWGNLIRVSVNAEGEEAAYHAGLRMLAEARRWPVYNQPEPIRRQTFDALRQNWGAVLDDTIFDTRAHEGRGTSTTLADAGLAIVAVERHDWREAARILDRHGPDDAAMAWPRTYFRARQALEQDHPAEAIAALEPSYALYRTDPKTRAYYPAIPCLLGLAYALADRAEAATGALETGRRWVACAAYRGVMLQRLGRPGADAAYRAAIALAPDLPTAYQQYGLALLHKGDVKSAILQFTASHNRGPDWADPLKSWGDALAYQKQPRAAAVKYAAARKLAPHWDALEQAAGRVRSKATVR